MGQIAVAVVMAGLAVITATRVHVWGSPERLWTEATAHSPEKPRPLIHLALQYTRRDADDLAAEALMKAWRLSEQPERFALEGPMRGHHVAALNLAMLRAYHGDYDTALRLTEAIQPRPAGRESLVTRLEMQWLHEREHGGPVADF